MKELAQQHLGVLNSAKIVSVNIGWFQPVFCQQL
jgi:hypothetical protein